MLIDRLEKWTKDLTALQPSAERAIGKRKRDHEENKPQTEFLTNICIKKDDLEEVTQILSDHLHQNNRMGQVLVYFYLEFIKAALSCPTFGDNHNFLCIVKLVKSNFVNFVQAHTQILCSNISRKELLLQILYQMYQVWTSHYQSENLLCAFDILQHLLSIADSSEVHPTQHFFISGALSHKRFQSELRRLSTLFLSYSTTFCSRDHFEENNSVLLTTATLWLRSSELLPVETVVLELANNDEILFEYLLAVVTATRSIQSWSQKDREHLAVELPGFEAALWNEVVRGLVVLVDQVLLWDETTLLDLISSEETVALEYWLRVMKLLQISDVASVTTRAESTPLNDDNPLLLPAPVTAEQQQQQQQQQQQTAARILILVEETTVQQYPQSMGDVPPSMHPDHISVVPIKETTHSEDERDVNDEEDSLSETTNPVEEQDPGSNTRNFLDEFVGVYAEENVDDLSVAGSAAVVAEQSNRQKGQNKEDILHTAVDNAEDDSEITTMIIWQGFLQRLQETLHRRHRRALLSFAPHPLIRAMDHFLLTPTPIDPAVHTS